MSAVIAERIAANTAVVSLRGADGRNAFTPELLSALRASVDELSHDAEVRVIVLRGATDWFSSGASRAELRTLSAGGADFRDLGVARTLIDAPVPVIAALEGHAFGGGLVLGLTADVAVLAEESMYAANFMRLGFTPGMGCTRLLPARLGGPLAAEMMLTGRGYRGAELRARGVGLPVVPRSEVFSRSLGVAAEIAEKPRDSLVLLKRHLTRPLRASLGAAYEEEVEMHRLTMALPEVRVRIEELPDA